MTAVKDSALYKALKKAVRRQDHAELLRMLEMVPTEWPNSMERESLTTAFSWGNTPHGFYYWYNLRNRLRDAGHDCY